MATPDRAAALARLVELGAATAASDTGEETVTRTGNEVEAGGDVAVLLTRPARHLSYVKDGARYYVQAAAGDVVLVDKATADRLRKYAGAVDPDASEEEVAAGASGEVTDEQLGAMSAADLVAHVVQHPEHRERVRALEEARPEDKRRKTVLEATDPEKVEQAENGGQ